MMQNEIKNIKASLWISASAGTGKTKNLVDRILALLLNGIQPSKILCLTYTKAAAAEMLSRLSGYLKKLHMMLEEDLKSELIKIGFSSSYTDIAKSLYEKSMQANWVSIQTIHSFCFDILKKFPLETGLMPGIKLCDDYKRSQLLSEAVNSVLADDKYHDYWEIISEYTTDISEIIKEHAVMDIQHFVDKTNDFLSTYSDFFNLDSDYWMLSDKQVNDRLFIKIFNNEHRILFSELSQILYSGSSTDIRAAEILYRNSIDPTEDFVKAFLNEENEIRANLCTKKISNSFFLERMRKTAQKALEFLDLKKRYTSAKVNTALFSVIKEIISKFRELKTSHHCLNFNDIILLTLTLLNDIDWIMYKIDGGVDHILLDEAQDTSPEQWEIIKKITDEFFAHSETNKTVCIVGDEKQSIYSFQGADVKLFNKMHIYFRDRSVSCGQDFFDITLSKSYRTTGNILSFVDSIFADKFPNTKHTSNRELNRGLIEIVDIFEDDEEESDGFNYNKRTARKKLSLYLAEFIKNTIDKKVFVESKNRAAKPSDFLILFQRRNIATMKSIISALKEANVSVTGIDKILLKDELIVEDLINLAEFSVFPLGDLSCARVLKSPIIGMTERDLMDVCVNRKKQRLWHYLQENSEMSMKYSLDNLTNYVEKAFLLSAYDFFMTVLTSGLMEKFISRLGEKCLDILYDFLDIVINYEKTNTPTLQSFLKWFRSFEHEIKRESFSEENAVRLMTSHASKGLQSPFVILADSHFFRAKGNVILKSDEGILLWNFSSNCRPDSVTKLHIKDLQANEEESNRLLYVSLTRAEDFLYIMGEKHQKPPNEKCWYNLIRSNIVDGKFQKNKISEVSLQRFGDYSYSRDILENIDESQLASLPDWFNEKLETLEKIENEKKTSQMIYGDCIHLLLNEMPKYIENELFDDIADSFIENFDLSYEERQTAKLEAHSVIKKFGFLFDEKSRSEVIFMHNGKEGRIDKIAFQDSHLWVVDFKTGAPTQIISSKYILQLQLYKEAVKAIYDFGHSTTMNKLDIRTGILWTQSAEFIEVSM